MRAERVPAVVQSQLLAVGLPLLPGGLAVGFFTDESAFLAQDAAGHLETMPHVDPAQTPAPGPLAQRTDEAFGGLGAVGSAPLFPPGQIVECAPVPPQWHLAGLLAFGDGPADEEVGPFEASAYILDLQPGDLAGPQAAAGRQAEDHEVLGAVDGTSGAALEIREHEGDLSAGEDLAGIDFPMQCHTYSPAETWTLLRHAASIARHGGQRKREYVFVANYVYNLAPGRCACPREMEEELAAALSAGGPESPALLMRFTRDIRMICRCSSSMCLIRIIRRIKSFWYLACQCNTRFSIHI